MSHVFCIYAESIRDERMDYGITWGYGIESELAHELDLSLPAEAIRIPPAASVHTILRVGLGESILEPTRHTISAYRANFDIAKIPS